LGTFGPALRACAESHRGGLEEKKDGAAFFNRTRPGAASTTGFFKTIENGAYFDLPLEQQTPIFQRDIPLTANNFDTRCHSNNEPVQVLRSATGVLK
jgi:hypothetical protein